jgi:hypothetical protein
VQGGPLTVPHLTEPSVRKPVRLPPWPMAVRRFVWRASYEALAKRVPTSDWAFINGYSPATVDASTPPLRSSDKRDRLYIQLYLYAIDNLLSVQRPMTAFIGVRGEGSAA